MQAKRPRILVLRLSALGDVLVAMGAVSTLRGALPQAHITWMVEDRFAGILASYADIDDIIVFERKRMREGLRRWRSIGRSIGEARRLRRELRSRDFDISIDFQGNLKSGVLGRMAGARRRIGFARGHCRERNHWFTGEHVTPPDGTVHRMAKDLALVRHLDADAAFRPPRFRPGADDRRVADEYLAERGIADRPFALLHPGTSKFGDFKRWPAAQYVELGRRLHQELQLQLVVSWGPGEEELAREVAGGLPGNDTIGPKTGSLSQLVALVDRSALYVGADTGVTHLAAALQVPTVALFGPKDPDIYAPAGDHVAVVTHDVDCRPCGKRYCPYGHIDCMNKMEVEPVLAAARRVYRPARTV